MKACIMCGGEGTRLRPLTFDRPKPVIPITNRPSLVHLIEHLSKEGFNDIIITVGYMAEKIEENLGNGSMFGVHIDYVYEEDRLGTAGSVKNAEEYLGDEPFIVVGGDHVMNLDLRNMWRFHESNNAMVTIGLLSIDDPREFGIADMDVNNRISRFLEKPGPGEIFSNLASTGIYMCQSEILNWIPKGKKFDFAKDLFPAFLENNIVIRGFLVRGQWSDVGTPQAYRQAQRWMLETMPGTSIEGHFNAKNARIIGPLKISNNVVIGSNSAVVGPVVLGDNTTIGNNVLIGPYTTIASNCVVKNGCRILSSYLYSDVTIGKNCNVSGSVIDSNTVVGQDCSLENGTVIGPRVNIGSESTIHSDVRIWPEMTIKCGSRIKEDLLNPDYK
jgi:mannose-1-phosphate guanylyltransferase